MLTLVTVTCDQPVGLALAEKWVGRQTVPYGEWIVVDDGAVPATVTMGQVLVRRARGSDTGAQSFCRNLLAALPHIRGDVVAMIEHDDYYAPTHLERSLDLLARPGAMIAGDDRQRYFNVSARRWYEYQNKGAAMCQTVFRSALLPELEAEVRRRLALDQYGVDAAFWATRPPETQALERIRTVVGIKGLPGRVGLGVGHRPNVVRRWFDDPSMKKLFEWIGADAVTYAGFRGAQG